MSGPSIQRAGDIQPGGCPGGAEYGRGLSRTVVHAGGCCERWAKVQDAVLGLDAEGIDPVEEAKLEAQADAGEMLADALELGEFDDGERPDPRRWAR
jgi:hypothetical protein